MSDVSLPVPADEPRTKPADPQAVKEFWAQTLRPIANSARLDKVPTIRARNARERDIAQKHNAVLTYATFSGTDSEAYRRGYERIRWHGRDD